ncbi:Sir2 family histone deacetylase Hst4 [Drechmeria coniospora]|uniref:Sir2 family histone deacetylase Hst4 n=1 Tax=Drechmeria coniospora TaxID=98403 RepID=A0A151GKX4_DRECN|nr:Sir2 family histone deacetylase Hst4 [Drechmeria coniospora]KYK57747.1 Sir2 family histone deacetylase Hst4 [Drechmeria coniospora]ODA79635.1 hypothetical protein RJ55_05229 [Drechmeria coniospora]
MDASTASSSPLSSPLSSATSSPLGSLSVSPSLPSSPVMMARQQEPQEQRRKRHPLPSGRYLSPVSLTTSGTQSPIKLGEPMDDSPPPAKKRRVSPPKDRSTKYLNLMKPQHECTNEDNFHLERLLSALRKKKKIVVIAGAGISVSAGIPDFRSATGLFATARSQHKLKASGKHLFDASVYKHDASTHSFHTMVREMSDMTRNVSPTPFHHLLASLSKEGRLLRLYSQNIDCIDTSMEPLRTSVPLEPKGPWPPTIQLHGGLQMMVCTKCGDLKPFNGDLFDGPEAPLCDMCKEQDQVRTAYAGKRSHGIGRLRPRFVLYNEFNPDEDAIGNVARADLKARPDAVLVVGTTLKVPGTRRLVKEMCQVARGRKDGFTAWINIDPEPKGADFKDCWDLVVRSKCDSVARLAALPPFDCQIGDDYALSDEQFASCRKDSIEVGIRSPPASAADDGLDAEPPHQVDGIAVFPTPQPTPPLATKKKSANSRQTQISFGQKVDGEKAGPPPKTTRPRGRKPKQPAAAAKATPPATIMQKFKSVKSISAQDVAKNAAKDVGLHGSPLQRSVLSLDSEPCLSLPSLRPDHGASEEDFRCKRDPSDDAAAAADAPNRVPNTLRDPIDSAS